MTEEQFNKAKELMKHKQYYADLANAIARAQCEKKEKDKHALLHEPRRTIYKDSWLLSKYFTIKLYKREEEGEDKLKVGVLPHWDCARTIEIDAETELIDLIQQWLERKASDLQNQINEI